MKSNYLLLKKLVKIPLSVRFINYYYWKLINKLKIN